jgi:clan AA aspartic protease
MINGSVNSALEPKIEVNVHDASGKPQLIEALIDTGYNGFLTLQPALISTLGLAWLCRQQGQLADGSIQSLDVYLATILWDGQPRTIGVEAADGDALLGTALLVRYEVRMQFVDGGSVTIDKLP